MRNQILGGRYRILERIGEGGMAFVYRALDEKLQRQVAIKVLHEHMAGNPEIRERFQHEARAASSLEHPNIVKIYDFSGADSDCLWLVTEELKGQNLAQFTRRFHACQLHPVVACAIVRETCKALGMAHNNGIVHRDIKPENVMFTDHGEVKLMDFGIAKNLQRSSMTMTGTFMGSPSYMSPEQVRGRNVDHRSDIYSMGVLFYEVVTGRLPFTGQTTHEVVMKIVEANLVAPRHYVPQLPSNVEAMILRCMDKDPTRRYDLIDDLGSEIDSFLGGMGFVESNVELQRFQADRLAYQKRLAEMVPSMTRIRSRSGQTPPPQSGLRAPREQTDSASRTQPIRPANGTFTPRIIENVPAPQAPVAPPPQPQVIPPAPQRHAGQPAASAQTQNVPATPRPPQLTPVPRAAHAEEPRTQGMRFPGPQQPRTSMPMSTERPAARPAPVQQRGRPARNLQGYHYRHRPNQNWSNQTPTSFVGVLLVLAILGMAVWGFLGIQKRLEELRPKKSPHTNRPALTVPATIPRRVNVQQPPAPKPAIVAPAPEKTGATDDTPSQPKTKKTDKPKAVKKPLKSPALAASGDGAIERYTVEPADEPVAAKPATKAQTQPKTDAPAASVEQSPSDDDKPSPHASKSTGEISTSSRPAAEVYVDGVRLGTTVDRTSESGWLTLKTGPHSLELRRRGFETWRTEFTLRGGERKSFPLVTLQTAQSNAPAAATLTLKASPAPVQVSVQGIDNKTTMSFTMNNPSRTLELPPGRYRVRLTHKNDIREREIVLLGATGSLTFSVEFKDKEEEAQP